MVLVITMLRYPHHDLQWNRWLPCVELTSHPSARISLVVYIYIYILMAEGISRVSNVFTALNSLLDHQ